MQDEQRIVIYDEDLRIEAYQFLGIMQRFSTHFHEHYVIGIIEKGKRKLTYNNSDIFIETGQIVLFNPRDKHACEQIDDQKLDFRCLNVTEDVMQAVMKDITGNAQLPSFQKPVIMNEEIYTWIHDLHTLIMQHADAIVKEEALYMLIEQLCKQTSYTISNLNEQQVDKRIESVRAYLQEHYQMHISLRKMAVIADMNKYHLIRYFTKVEGITPYRYLQTIRVNEARLLLQQGKEPIEIADMTGFSDQSHFSNTFREFIGVTPKQYQNIFKNKEIA